MTKAEQAAMDYILTSASPFPNTETAAVIYGYMRAEKDLALTWEDIRTITKILEEVTEEVIPVEFYNGDAIGCFKEVLRRFKEANNDGNGTVHP